MEATELRVGNLIIIPNGEIAKVNYHIIRAMFVLDPKPNYKPIPLTEEWLLKFGFYKSFNSFCKHKSKFMLFNENCNNNNDELNLVINGCSISDNYKIRYVHQLQNLYFALTGKELTIKE